ncbi:DUF6114 domain-containing protein [Agromyces sp. MMS24-K17]|uniref:DUF6114 domain-containing protein n=1 Tax=Agromyces sp. MMS24-K17 TaxID=3372850 RepID=UPI0037541D92
MDAHPDALVSPFDAPTDPPTRGRRRRDLAIVDGPASRAAVTDAPDSPDAPADDVRAGSSGAFATWFRSRPAIGGLITIVGGLAMFFSSQLQLGGMTVHVGIEGAQAMILPAVLVVCGALAIFSPAQHVFYGIVALIISVYSLVGVNLGGFFVGFLLGSIGGVVVASWRRREPAAELVEAAEPAELPAEASVEAPVAPAPVADRA